MSPEAWSHDKRRSGGDTAGAGGLGVGELDTQPTTQLDSPSHVDSVKACCKSVFNYSK